VSAAVRSKRAHAFVRPDDALLRVKTADPVVCAERQTTVRAQPAAHALKSLALSGVMSSGLGQKRPKWKARFPDEYEEASQLVKDFVTEYTPDKWKQMNTSTREKVNSDLKNKVGHILPAEMKAATKSKDGVDNFLGLHKSKHRKSAGQPAINKSKHAAAGGKRHSPEEEVKEARRDRAAGTLSAYDPRSELLDQIERVREHPLTLVCKAGSRENVSPARN